MAGSQRIKGPPRPRPTPTPALEGPARSWIFSAAQPNFPKKRFYNCTTSVSETFVRPFAKTKLVSESATTP